MKKSIVSSRRSVKKLLVVADIYHPAPIDRQAEVGNGSVYRQLSYPTCEVYRSMKPEKMFAGTDKDEQGVQGMFNGPVLRLLTKLSLPILAGMLFQFLYNITDIIWISRIDMEDPSFVGGTGVVFPLLFMAIAIANGLSTGVGSLVARSIGQKNDTALMRIPESGLCIALVFSMLLVVIFYLFDDRFLTLLGAEGDYYIHAKEYLRWIIPAGVLLFIGNVLFGIIQGEGRMSKLMNGMIIGTVTNIVLDPLFIFTAGLGVRGAALATTVAQLAVVLYIVSVFLRKQSRVTIYWRRSHIDVSIIKQIIVVGFPQAAGMVVMAFSFLIFNRIVIAIDPLALTSFSICGRVDQLVTMPIFAIAAALLTMAGQNAGRGNFDRVERIWTVGWRTGVAVVAAVSTVIFIAAPKIFPFFSDIPRVVHYAVVQTRIIEYTYMPAVFGILGRALFQSIGHPIPGLMLTLLRLVAVAVPAVIIYVYVFDLGIYGVWFGVITGNVVSAIVCWFWVKKAIRDLKSGLLQVLGTGRTGVE